VLSKKFSSISEFCKFGSVITTLYYMAWIKFVRTFHVSWPIWVELSRRDLSSWMSRQSAPWKPHLRPSPHSTDSLADLHAMLLSTCEFRNKQIMESRTFILGVNKITCPCAVNLLSDSESRERLTLVKPVKSPPANKIKRVAWVCINGTGETQRHRHTGREHCNVATVMQFVAVRFVQP
jgi:hypothetical protein